MLISVYFLTPTTFFAACWVEFSLASARRFLRMIFATASSPILENFWPLKKFVTMLGIQILKQLTVIFTAIQKMSLKSSQRLIKKKKKQGRWITRWRNNLQNGNGKVWLKMGKLMMTFMWIWPWMRHLTSKNHNNNS